LFFYKFRIHIFISENSSPDLDSDIEILDQVSAQIAAAAIPAAAAASPIVAASPVVADSHIVAASPVASAQSSSDRISPEKSKPPPPLQREDDLHSMDDLLASLSDGDHSPKLGTSRLSRPVSRGTEGSKTPFDDQVSTSSIEERIGSLQLVDFVSTNTDNAISDKEFLINIFSPCLPIQETLDNCKKVEPELVAQLPALMEQRVVEIERKRADLALLYDCLENHGHRFKEDNVKSCNMLDQLNYLTSRKNHFSPDRDWMPLKLVKASPVDALSLLSSDDEEVKKTRSRTKSPAKNGLADSSGDEFAFLDTDKQNSVDEWSKIFSNPPKAGSSSTGKGKGRGKGRRGRGKKN